ncbi:MAG: hypothetical protein E7647_04730 [Ruminococcaceae bacterium]|nr:hypothetical protein [Oscillospiraceae bacterium]
MAKKDGMYFYNDWLTPFEKLEKEEVGELVIAMMRYFIYGEEPPRFSGLTGMAQDFIFPQIDRSMEYANLGSRAKGVAKKKTGAKPVHVEVVPCAEEKNESPKTHKSEEVSTGEEPVLKAGEAEETAEKREVFPDSDRYKKQQLEDSFMRFWRAYPNKSGRQQAQAAFERLAPDSALLTKMIEAVNAQKATDRWRRDEGRYIPYPAKWIDERRWEDELSEGGGGVDDMEALKALVEKKRKRGSFDTDDFFEAALRNNPNV